MKFKITKRHAAIAALVAPLIFGIGYFVGYGFFAWWNR
jgi:hypothetical protein